MDNYVLVATGLFHPKGPRMLLQETWELSPGREGGRSRALGLGKELSGEKSFIRTIFCRKLVLRAPMIIKQASILALFQRGGKRNLPNPS